MKYQLIVKSKTDPLDITIRATIDVKKDKAFAYLLIDALNQMETEYVGDGNYYYIAKPIDLKKKII